MNKLYVDHDLVRKQAELHKQPSHKICDDFENIVDFVLIRENTGQWKPVFSHILCSEREKEFKNILDPAYSITLEEGEEVRIILINYIQNQLLDHLAEGS